MVTLGSCVRGKNSDTSQQQQPIQTEMYKPTINIWAREAMHPPTNEGLIYGINSY